MKKSLIHFYDSFRLNLGIKRFFKETRKSLDLLRRNIDNVMVFKLFNFLDIYIKNRIIKHYGADYRWGDEKSQNINKAAGNLGYGMFHYTFIRNIKPKRVLCVGSMYGFIPYMLAKACSDNKYGKVDFVDAGYDMYNPDDPASHNFGQGTWSKVNPKEHFSYFLNNRFIDTYTMTLENFTKANRTKYDYIFFDGEPTYKGLLRDFRLVWSRISNGGYFVLHDIHLKKVLSGFHLEFWKLWRDLDSYPVKLELSNSYSGMGIIQKRRGVQLPSKLR